MSRSDEDRSEAGSEAQVDARLQDRGGGAPCCWPVRLAPADEAQVGVQLDGGGRVCWASFTNFTGPLLNVVRLRGHQMICRRLRCITRDRVR